MGLSTHILDQVSGQPAQRVRVRVFCDDAVLSDQATNEDGRCQNLLGDLPLKSGVYKIVFSAGGYLLEKEYVEASPFFDEIEVTANITDVTRHYHIPLLLSPFGYSTYRGS